VTFCRIACLYRGLDEIIFANSGCLKIKQFFWKEDAICLIADH